MGGATPVSPRRARGCCTVRPARGPSTGVDIRRPSACRRTLGADAAARDVRVGESRSACSTTFLRSVRASSRAAANCLGMPHQREAIARVRTTACLPRLRPVEQGSRSVAVPLQHPFHRRDAHPRPPRNRWVAEKAVPLARVAVWAHRSDDDQRDKPFQGCVGRIVPVSETAGQARTPAATTSCRPARALGSPARDAWATGSGVMARCRQETPAPYRAMTSGAS